MILPRNTVGVIFVCCVDALRRIGLLGLAAAPNVGSTIKAINATCAICEDMRRVNFMLRVNLIKMQRHRCVAIADAVTATETLIQILATKIVNEITVGSDQLAIFEEHT